MIPLLTDRHLEVRRKPRSRLRAGIGEAPASSHRRASLEGRRRSVSLRRDLAVALRAKVKCAGTGERRARAIPNP
jgi:hypothetical protein